MHKALIWSVLTNLCWNLLTFTTPVSRTSLHTVDLRRPLPYGTLKSEYSLQDCQNPVLQGDDTMAHLNLSISTGHRARPS